MKIIFKIEFKYKNGYILGRLLKSENLNLEINSKLEVYNLKNIVPSDALIGGENKRNDLFIFSLKDDLHFENLKIEEIIELT
ncbi:hypothetical protein [Halpernia frigidisoli]|uniref:Uncharacterized protein n=1 Tax=Halpernia frigidisoli TaxID=1125876 RepID=A0A1I3FAS6_9FLAO|nr:hypothetical protein [Halpernia frigidisoli]SFI08326.1 hypothetical protein SAMN05443292_1256 [Halpernia frigidisoli]